MSYDTDVTVTGLTLVKRFEYRGDPNEEFSNKYWFKGAPPSDDASWNVLLNDVLAKERPATSNQVTYARAYGYNNSNKNAHHVFLHDWDVTGNNPIGTGTWVNQNVMAGDQAALVEWPTDKLSDPGGKRVYLRKYFHHGTLESGDLDSLAADYRTALTTFGGVAGINTIYGGLTGPLNDCGVITVATVPQWVTTRTLKRRGKRPKAA